MNDIRVRKLGYKQFTLANDDTKEIKTSDVEPDAKYDHYTAHCHMCGHKGKIKSFKSAYNEPMKHFDTDNLCYCGGEIWNDFEVKKLVETSENAEFDGDQRSVPMAVKTSIRCDRCGKLY